MGYHTYVPYGGTPDVPYVRFAYRYTGRNLGMLDVLWIQRGYNWYRRQHDWENRLTVHISVPGFMPDKRQNKLAPEIAPEIAPKLTDMNMSGNFWIWPIKFLFLRHIIQNSTQTGLGPWWKFLRLKHFTRMLQSYTDFGKNCSGIDN